MIEVLKAVVALMVVVIVGGAGLWLMFWVLKKIFHLDK